MLEHKRILMNIFCKISEHSKKNKKTNSIRMDLIRLGLGLCCLWGSGWWSLLLGLYRQRALLVLSELLVYLSITVKFWWCQTQTVHLYMEPSDYWSQIINLLSVKKCSQIFSLSQKSNSDHQSSVLLIQTVNRASGLLLRMFLWIRNQILTPESIDLNRLIESGSVCS